ncbi:substrate-binding domain-containing protein [Variovorax sp. J22G73]|uniref:substrate-binding domain-containing protein n=1 Tax=unclassified Variovorax TaxID=663243 RepID=UPI00257730CA|nr:MULTISPECIES: substrate-binding domain-containing protein [unclassified Variovorax]MDM0005451.1 substrate-binding domain-containing protein [Variovorax sp. J22R203]MDM0099478.1 substrate-binding domain-containing protein [Variovorax sp. J22G73]
MDRRTFLHGLAAAAAASAAGVRAASPLNVAVILPMSGPAGLFGPSAKACAELAVQTINARGGVLGRTINPLFGDAGLPPAEASQTALKLWKGQGAQAVIGMHDSAVRGALVGLFKGQVPYFYTPVYEGGECARGTYVNGETPAQQLAPVIPWLAAERKPKKWYLIGNDYIWGRNTNAAAKGYIAQTGAQVVGDEYLPFTADNFDSSLARIRDSGADAVLVSLMGGASVTFNKAFASFGLADKAIRLGSLLEENTLAGIGLANARNLYSSAGYFANIETPAAKAFSEAYFKRFGAQAPALNGLAESVYEGFLMLEAIATRAKSLDVAKMEPASEGASYSGPRGAVTMHARHVDQDIYLADVGDKGFRVVKTFAHIASGQTCKV